MKLNNLETNNKIGEKVLLKGWVNTIRKMGKIVFVDLRDRSGIVQVVLVPSELDEESVKSVKSIKSECVLEVEGLVQKRGEKQVNRDLATGQVEILAKSVKILAESATPPFEIDNEERQANEELRLKYRYLDLRHERMKKNLILRHQVVKYIREHLYKNDFIEIETPLLTVSTPEGARDYLVPSRNFKGRFYALPQSPQQYKQLLMVAGLERYFQIARCLRDEDQRGDRQPEHTQLDIEMSFVEPDEVMDLIEEMFNQLVKDLFPDKKLTFAKWPRITYEESMKKYKTDKPDLRKNKSDKNEIAFAWIIDFPLFIYNQEEKRIEPSHHLFTAPQPADIKLLDKEPLKVKALHYDFVCNGYELASGSVRIHESELQLKIMKIIGLSEKEAKKKFGHMLEAYKYGAPPHAGIAPGIDRLVMILAGEENIREVIAFPKTGDAREPMTGAPAEVTKEQLKELGIEVK